jgi:hypothetical protein
VVQRYVNYRIGEKGEYINREKIHTINILAVFEKEFSQIPGESPESPPIQSYIWRKINEYVMPYNKTLDNVYVGLEDVRVLYHDHKLVYNANRGLDHHRVAVEHGEILYPFHVKSSLVGLNGESPNNVEKNWVLFEDSDAKLKCIYQWYPLEIGEISSPGDDVGSSLEIQYRSKSPEIFKYLRGSTNGVSVGDNEIWFICHSVSYDSGRRYYYHMFVVLDKKTYRIKRYTIPFTFEKSPVEYTLGFIYEDSTKTFLIGYSVMDRETRFREISLDSVEKVFYYRET